MKSQSERKTMLCLSFAFRNLHHFPPDFSPRDAQHTAHTGATQTWAGRLAFGVWQLVTFGEVSQLSKLCFPLQENRVVMELRGTLQSEPGKQVGGLPEKPAPAMKCFQA